MHPDPYLISLALLLDLALGDPRWLPHPVVLIGKLISQLEGALRGCGWSGRGGGILLMAVTITASALSVWLLLLVTHRVHPVLGALTAVCISATCLAARSLHDESEVVARALMAGDLDGARSRLAWIVGRDTAGLDEADIWRALVETVAENTSDGIIAPLFWLAVAGPVGAMAYKAASTLDSMVGYRNERYLKMGWASARMDDLLNFIPARLTALLMVAAAPLAGLSLAGAFRIALRDRLKHPSPNSGHPEAAAAGALGVRLGGAASYAGVPSWKEQIGDALSPLDGRAYRGMIRLMYITTMLMAAASCAIALLLGAGHVTFL